jgi:hypothetical protein
LFVVSHCSFVLPNPLQFARSIAKSDKDSARVH